MSYNKGIIIGNLGRDPELRYTPQGKAVCNFSVATTETWGKGQDKNEKTVWFKVTCWGNQAENASKYLHKGDPVYVEGRIGKDEWTGRDGTKQVDITINASEIQYLKQRGDGGGNRNEYDQRRPGTDDHDQRTNAPAQAASDDALPLGGSNDDIPF